ncbi:sensor histidine kinase [Streptosporangium saharense]|uniref:histidine kinase n=1 Tax=Streptosporangium saharense TaxID=1706840 RepID=A0A7W7QGZ5_9ACTN|nr:HAMP domain-containing sensor histidine kinase [Streptosporangium saharense]MBB4913415.1 signal transduction histidine kinase [Streptosporangium saharense]
MKPTARTRLALACGAVFLVIGSLLLMGVYLLVRNSLEPRDGLGRPAYIGMPNGVYEANSPEYYVAVRRVEQVRRTYQRDTLSTLLTAGGAGLAGGTAIALWYGWWVGGWALRPVQQVTETARRVAQSHNLTERIAYTGPRDEVAELADVFDTMLTRLARAFDGQRRFVANASHELRTPLTINRTLVDVAVRRPDATDDLKRLGESLLLVNTRHERLIDGLLALAEGEQAVLDRRAFDLSDVVEHVLDQAGAEAAERSVTVHRLLDSVTTAGDPVLLERLVQNLVENAIRHNHEGGEVWVTTRQRADVAELVVANTGLPVPPYEIETIFEPFRRLHGDRLRSERGSGLGLSIVRAIADAHDGTITARPREEGGLTITTELPHPTPP